MRAAETRTVDWSRQSVLPDATVRLSAPEVDEIARMFRYCEQRSRSGRSRGDLWWALVGRGPFAKYQRDDFTDGDLRAIMARVEELDDVGGS